MAATVFCTEMSIMVVLSYFPEIPARIEPILDAALLTLLLTPAFYFLLYRPFMKHLADRQHTEQKISQMAFHDCLTGLPNRLLFRDRLSQALAFAGREKRQLAVVFFDLDHFKQVNDRLGHDAGDQLLKLAAHRLRGNLRRSDTAARMGGDEFIILLTGINSEEEILVVLRRLSQAIKAPCVLTNQEVILSASIGVSLYPRDGEDEETLLRKADQAMYMVKRRGRDGIFFYGDVCPQECFTAPGMTGTSFQL